MSFEGTRFQLCESGHLSWQDCYDERPPKCDVCDLDFVWDYLVDETNGAEESDYPWNFLRVKSEIKIDECIKAKELMYEIPLKQKEKENE